jgi:hypothetical protein
MKKISRKQARDVARCAWCGKPPDLRGVLVLLAKCHAGVTLPEGVTCYPFQLSGGKFVRAVVGTEDSQMKADGWDCGFPVCSVRSAGASSPLPCNGMGSYSRLN